MTGLALRIGTRGSPLALWQTHHVKDRLSEVSESPSFELITLKTRGESFPDHTFVEIGVGIFTRELDEALLRGDIDLAVHSSKDIPSRLPDGLILAAFLERESPLDAFVSATDARIEDLEPGARIGTGSPRRKAQILAARPDLEVVPLRGNVETRLRKIRSEGLAGTILAHAGLKRLEREDVITQVLTTDFILPAVGQGAVAVTTRADDEATRTLVNAIDHATTRRRVEAERAFSASSAVVARYLPAHWALSMRHRYDWRRSSPRPTVARQCDPRTGPPGDRESMGQELARELLEMGGRDILATLAERPDS